MTKSNTRQDFKILYEENGRPKGLISIPYAKIYMEGCFKLVLHRDYLDPKLFRVSEYNTGMIVSSGYQNEIAAQADARAKIRKYGVDFTKQRIQLWLNVRMRLERKVLDTVQLITYGLL